MQTDSASSTPDFIDSSGHRLAVRQRLALTEQQHGLAGPVPHVVFCGGFHSSMLGIKAAALADLCIRQQWSYTRFDYRGHGESEGEAAAAVLSDWLDDVLCILDSIEGPVLLVGSSMGAWLATLAACRRATQVRGLLLLAAAPDFLQELIQPRLSPSDIWDLQQGQAVMLPNAYADPYPITQALLDSGKPLSVLAEHPPGHQHDVASLTCPVRMIHGAADTDVPHTLSLRLMDKVAHPDAQLRLLHQADHRLSDTRALAVIDSTLLELVEAMTPDAAGFDA